MPPGLDPLAEFKTEIFYAFITQREYINKYKIAFFLKSILSIFHDLHAMVKNKKKSIHRSPPDRMREGIYCIWHPKNMKP